MNLLFRIVLIPIKVIIIAISGFIFIILFGIVDMFLYVVCEPVKAEVVEEFGFTMLDSIIRSVSKWGCPNKNY